MTSPLNSSLRRGATGIRHLTRTTTTVTTCINTTNKRPLTTKTTASDAANQLLDKFANNTIIRRQRLDANQLQKLSLTLNRRELHRGLDVSTTAPPTGTPLPQGYHLAYFTPGEVEAELGADGTDVSFNAVAPFTRRMWAGGRIEFEVDTPLRVGELAEERTRLMSAVPKRSRDGGEMVLVEVEKQFWGPEGLSLVDNRSWVFRPQVDPAAMRTVQQPAQSELIGGPSTMEDIEIDEDVLPRRHLRWSPVGLFRFSALTFNGHRIHYDENWARSVEGHPGCVVHGPLNLICILDYWRDVYSQYPAAGITYRALSPLYSGDNYHIRAVASNGSESKGGKTWDVLVEKDQTTCMKATIVQG